MILKLTIQMTLISNNNTFLNNNKNFNQIILTQTIPLNKLKDQVK